MGRQHPLDVFRSSRDGFDKASKRRRVVGRVIASSVKVKSSLTGTSTGGAGKAKRGGNSRPTSAGARPKTATSRGSAAWRGGSTQSPVSRVSRLLSGARLFASGPGRKKRSTAARKADGATRTMFFGATVMLSAVVLVLVFKQFWLGDGMGELPTMKLADGLPEGPGGALAPSAAPREPGTEPVSGAQAMEWFTIRAATYNGSKRGLELGTAALQELARRGLPGVSLIGQERAGGEEGYESIELIVGSGRSKQVLQATLDRLLAIDDWDGGKSAPFVDARIVPHPVPEGLESDS